MTIETVTCDAVDAIIDAPRTIEHLWAEAFGPERPDFYMGLDFARVFRFEDRPVVVLGYAIRDPFVTYHACATPEAHRWPMFFTKIGRSFVEFGIEQYPDHHHMAMALPGSPAHSWLKVLGFRDSREAVWGTQIVAEMYFPK